MAVDLSLSVPALLSIRPPRTRRESLGPLGLSRRFAFPHHCLTLMNLGELIELAAIVAARAPLLIESDRSLAPEAVARYWSASKCRQQRWAQALKQLSAAGGHEPDLSISSDDEPPVSRPSDIDARLLLQEIFASEVLTRVWTAVVALHDRRRQTADAEPVVRSVLLGHLEARRRALTLLVRGPGVHSQEAVDLNRLRRRAERRNDMLMGYLLIHGDVSEFAFDAELAAEFARDFRGEQGWAAGGIAWTVVMASLRAESRAVLSATRPNQDLNDQIGAAILGCFGHDMFDSLGLPRSLWSARMLQTAESAQGLIEHMFAAERIGTRGRR